MIDNINEIIKKAEILIEALPYIQQFTGKTVIIKYGGNAMINNELKNSVMEDITLLKYIGVNPIVIHGGGPDINNMLKRLNITSDFINGLRVTDEQTIEVVQMVLIGKTNKEVVSLINKKGGKAIGISGMDSKLLECVRHKEIVDGRETDLGLVGRIIKVNSQILDLLCRDQYIPVIAPIGIGNDGQCYNINADTVAGEIAAALNAEKLILLTDVEGISSSDGKNEIYATLTSDEAHELIKSGVISGGMIPKVLSCLEAVSRGVARTHIIDGRIPHCILLEIFTNEGIGTMIIKDRLPAM